MDWLPAQLRHAWAWLRCRHVELPPGRYELRYTYDPNTTLGEADVRSRHVQLHDAAEAFATCTAPYKQLIWSYDAGGADELDEREQKYLERVCAEHGLEVEQRDYGA
jgi:hypothetical protein